MFMLCPNNFFFTKHLVNTHVTVPMANLCLTDKQQILLCPYLWIGLVILMVLKIESSQSIQPRTRYCQNRFFDLIAPAFKTMVIPLQHNLLLVKRIIIHVVILTFCKKHALSIYNYLFFLLFYLVHCLRD